MRLNAVCGEVEHRSDLKAVRRGSNWPWIKVRKRLQKTPRMEPKSESNQPKARTAARPKMKGRDISETGICARAGVGNGAVFRSINDLSPNISTLAKAADLGSS